MEATGDGGARRSAWPAGVSWPAVRARVRRPRPRPRVVDGALTAVVTVVSLALLALRPWEHAPFSLSVNDPDALTVLLILVQTLPLWWRRRRPVLVLAVTAGAYLVHLLLGYPDTGSSLATVLALYTVGAYCGLRASAAAFGAAVALFTVLATASWGALAPVEVRASAREVLGEKLDLATLIAIPAYYGAAWGLGRYVRVRRAYTGALLARAELAERQREGEARRAVAEERARIARELHDVVAHHVSVMVIQAGAGRRLLDADPERVRSALAAVEDTGRQALTAMPRLLGSLREDAPEADRAVDRADGGADALAPQPTLGDLDALVVQVSAAGLPVDLRVEGRPRPLPPGVDLSAYRIVQEALTNSLKHAGPARARLVVRHADDALVLTVVDDGRGADRPGHGAGDGAGHGLVGMRERVTLFGGELHAGPRPRGGFAVTARFPLDPAREPAGP